MLPATAARFWAAPVWSLAVVSALIAILSGLGGLLLSYHCNLPSDPAIVLWAGGLHVVSILFGPRDGVFSHWRTGPAPEV